MNFSVKITENFRKEAKRLAKKYPSLKSDLEVLIRELEVNPEKETALGYNIFKIRMAIASKGKGKSGGARVITLVEISDNTVYLISIYNKGDIDSISVDEILTIINTYFG